MFKQAQALEILPLEIRLSAPMVAQVRLVEVVAARFIMPAWKSHVEVVVVRYTVEVYVDSGRYDVSIGVLVCVSVVVLSTDVKVEVEA